MITHTNDLQIFATHDEASAACRNYQGAAPLERTAANGMSFWVVLRNNGRRAVYLRDDGKFN